mmetsp:Transcript_24317/g.78501  ORF Transcript_24317/g.78501 Transcript_24317/m.78501 type:complete len:234 (-) Transcript_24317:474-1175(-)
MAARTRPEAASRFGTRRHLRKWATLGAASAQPRAVERERTRRRYSSWGRRPPNATLRGFGTPWTWRDWIPKVRCQCSNCPDDRGCRIATTAAEGGGCGSALTCRVLLTPSSASRARSPRAARLASGRGARAWRCAPGATRSSSGWRRWMPRVRWSLPTSSEMCSATWPRERHSWSTVPRWRTHRLLRRPFLLRQWHRHRTRQRHRWRARLSGGTRSRCQRSFRLSRAARWAAR